VEARPSPAQNSSSLAASLSSAEELDDLQDSFWRDEVVSRLQQHRARRRRRSDPDASMELDFQEEPVSVSSQREAPTLPVQRPPKLEPPKIIEFPRPAAATPRSQSPAPQIKTARPEDLELAEPVIKAPRILDAPEPPPEQMELLPAFADIQLAAEDALRGQDFDLPIQPAAIAFRAFAGLVDLLLVVAATALFVFGFMPFAKGVPQPRITMLFGLLISGSLWLIYQYVFLVYSRETPGMQLAQLELCTFTGEPAPVSVRRWRAIASALSAVAVGLGFVWACVDEDTLGWHDRITQTHLKSK
jgi:uncharacterized RDD family membrane protein YckC